MSSSGRKIILKSSDGEVFEVDEAVVLQSQTMMEADNEITLPKVPGEILAKVIDYCKKHVEAPKTNCFTATDELKSWDRDFVNVPKITLFGLVVAAELLKIEGLRDLACGKVADNLKSKTPAQIREYLRTA
ncbi:hypothetical protein PTKIN_Ptkin12aG0181800 [Pterospermum kingtungense]